MSSLELGLTILGVGLFLLVELILAIRTFRLLRRLRAQRRADEQEEAAIVRLVGNPRRPSRRRDG